MLTSRLLILNQKEAECKEMAAYFQDSGYSVIWCTEYDEATEILSRGKNKPDLLIFDVDLPKRREYEALGITVLQEARKNHVSTPVIMLTALGELQDKLTGLKGGADDYMVKPAPLPLLEAHVEAVIRRTAEKRNPVESVGALSIDYEGRKIYLADKVLKVTAKEFDLLEYFVKHKGMILSRDKILDSVWGFDYIGG